MSVDAFESLDLDVQGMTCASCAARVEKKLNKLDGVQASVNYATERAHIVAPTGVSVADLIKVVEQAGYGASVPEPDAVPVDHTALIRRRLIVAVALSLPVILMAMIPPLQFPGWQWVSWVLATPVWAWSGWVFHRSALVNLRHGATTMDTLISLGTTAAYLWSVYALFFGHAGHIGMTHGFEWGLSRDDTLSGVYFEAACGIIAFVLIGRYIESRSRKEAGAALEALLSMGAKTVLVLRNGVETMEPIESLQVGDQFVILPGSQVAADGKVIDGQSAVDASIITGESVPVEVVPGSQVIGATMNTTGRLVVEATAVGADTQLSQIARLVELAQTGKTNTQRLADRISAVFVPIVITISLVTLVTWLALGYGISMAITAAVSVLIISCPCALGLATPTALLAGTSRGAELGIVIKGAEALEHAYRVNTVVMDKTGTITTGQMTLQDFRGSAEAGARLAALEGYSEHPIAKAIVRGIPGSELTVSDFENLPGQGLTGVIAGTQIFVGKPALMLGQGYEIPAEFTPKPDEIATAVLIAYDGAVQGLALIADQVAENSAAAIKALQGLGLKTLMLTGDNESVARQVAAEVGIEEVRADVLPSDKLAVIAGLQDKTHVVAMIGDGVNDAAALTQSDLGIAMGGGTDVAIAASDITLMRHDLMLAADAIKLSRRTFATIRGNLFWAFAYNVAAIPLAALGFLTPMLAGAAMAFSSVFVVTNSLRLKGFNAQTGEQ